MLAEPFLAALDSRPPLLGLEARLETLWSRARAAWPLLSLDAADLMTHLARHAPPEHIDGYLVDVYIEDLALAYACNRHDPTALRDLETRCLRVIPRALARLGATAVADDVAQRLRYRFLVERKIAEYSGRGPLDAWIRTAAVRAAVDILRAERREAGAAGELTALPAGAIDPELDLLRGRYAELIREALQRALDTLPPRERNLLRFSYVDLLSIDEIGVLYRIHRTTAGRWVARARDALVAETRRLVRERLPLSDPELDSLLHAVRSYLHISVGGLRYCADE